MIGSLCHLRAIKETLAVAGEAEPSDEGTMAETPKLTSRLYKESFPLSLIVTPGTEIKTNTKTKGMTSTSKSVFWEKFQRKV